MTHDAASLQVSLSHDERVFTSPHWRRLLARDPTHHVFATPEWNALWWEERSLGKRLVVLELAGDGDPVAIVPLYLEDQDGRRVLRFVGGVDLTDYLGPICAPEDREAVAGRLVRWLIETDLDWDELDAHNMPVPHGFGEFLVDHADRGGLSFALDQEQTSAILLLPGAWEDYVASLDAKARHELRRKLRRLSREHSEAEFRAATPESLEFDLATFIDMYRAQDHKGHFMQPNVAGFFEKVARTFMPLGWLRLDLLEIAGHPVAATFGFGLGSAFYLYNSAFVPAARRLSPGVVLVAHLVRRSIAEGHAVFDFLRGPERYKYQFGAEPVPLNHVRVLNERSDQ
jgi:CelD/BcsL family acetyltransferase involved in cellulose biosynthesis